MNKCFIIGNVAHTPEVKTTTSGLSVCTFSVAVNRRKSKDGTQECDFFNVTVWRQLADLCGKYLEKGRKVAVSGPMQSRHYEGCDGSKRVAWEIVADEVEFLSPKSAVSETPAPKKEEFTEVEEADLPF